MKSKAVSGMMLTLLLIGMLTLAFNIQQVYALSGFQPGTGETTKIWLMDASDPTAVPVTYPDGQQYIELNDTYSLGQTFTVWANITDVTKLRGYAVGVTYNDSILECTSYSEGEFFYRVPLEYRDSPATPDLFAGSGELGYWNHVSWVLKKPGNVSGTGTVAVFNFKVVGYGATLIDIILTGAKLAALMSVEPPHDVPPGMPFNTIDIIFDNTELVADHELRVFVEALEVLKVGESSLLNATVYNIGLNNETDVELQLLINGTVKESETISELLTLSSYTIDYLWTPTEATYNVTAYAELVPDENCTDNNVATKFVLVPPPYWCINHPVVWDSVTYYVGTCSNAIVSDLTFSQPDKQIIFDFTAPWYEVTGDFWCNVSIPKALLDAPADRWVVRTAGLTITTRTVSSNDTHTSVYFISPATPYDPTPVDITAIHARAVGGKATPINIPMNNPETPTLWIWLTTIILPLLATVVYVKFKKKKQ